MMHFQLLMSYGGIQKKHTGSFFLAQDLYTENLKPHILLGSYVLPHRTVRVSHKILG